MAKTKTSSEEIIEKKESTPVASASLVLSFVAILGAIVFCLLEITYYRTDLTASAADSSAPGMWTATRDLDSLKKRVNGILNNQLPGDDEGFDDDDMEDEGEFEDEDEEESEDEDEFEVEDEDEFEDEESEDGDL